MAGLWRAYDRGLRRVTEGVPKHNGQDVFLNLTGQLVGSLRSGLPHGKDSVSAT